MSSRVLGAVQACWNLFEFRSVRITPTVIVLDMHLPGERNVLIRNTRLPRSLKPSTLERYFSRPSDYQEMDYMTYYESVKLYKKLPKSISEENARIDHANPPMYIVDRAEETERVVARIRTAFPVNVDLFALRLLVTNRRFS